jgi:hypothetical protein
MLCAATHRGFESHPFRHFTFVIQISNRYPPTRLNVETLSAMIKSKSLRAVAVALVALCFVSFAAVTEAQKKTTKRLAVCGNPKASCPSTATFEPHDLPFRVPQNAVIWETELFYAVILKSMKASDDDCKMFIPEAERHAAQNLFPDKKVFTSRCIEPGTLYYTNTRPNTRLMAVYAGSTLADANRMLAAVKATGKYSGASIRRMRAGFNGT